MLHSRQLCTPSIRVLLIPRYQVCSAMYVLEEMFTSSLEAHIETRDVNYQCILFLVPREEVLSDALGLNCTPYRTPRTMFVFPISKV